MAEEKITSLGLVWDDGKAGCIVIIKGEISEEEAKKIRDKVINEVGEDMYDVNDYVEELEKQGYEVITTICYDETGPDVDVSIWF